jgi:hypothetical protein
MKYIVLTEEDGALFPVLDHAAEPIGDRFPIKIFPSVNVALTFMDTSNMAKEPISILKI